MEGKENGFEVAIIGGGAAGMSAALWCDELGLTSVLIEERTHLGGQLHHIYNPIENYLGMKAEGGKELFEHFDKSLASRNFVRRTGIKAVSIRPEEMAVELEAGTDRVETVSFKALIIATGVRRRTLGIPGELEFAGRGVLESGARDKASVSGKRVLIVGGGDAAFENALILSDFATSVKVAFRRSEPTARREFRDAVMQRKNVELLPETEVRELAGDSFIRSAILSTNGADDREEPVDSVLFRIGVRPNSELVADLVNLDDQGYIKVDQTGLTSLPNIYSVGDVANPDSPTLSTAAGTAATAVKAIFHITRNPKEL